MKLTITVLALLFVNISYGQLLNGKVSGVTLTGQERYKDTDTIPVVFYLDDDKSSTNLLVYVDGVIVDQNIMNAINFEMIEAINVNKEPDRVDLSKYDGMLEITMKDGYSPTFISLNELKKKYIKELEESILFMMNGETIKADYDGFLVDEKYILKIEVEKIKNKKEGLHLNIINLVTRTKENLKKANSIRLRGEKS